METVDLRSLAGGLVDGVAPGIVQDEQHGEELQDWILREIKQDSHGGTRREWSDASSALDGLARTARVRVLDSYADALDKVHDALEQKVAAAGAWEGDSTVKMWNIPQYIQLLLNLSTRPSAPALAAAEKILQRKADSSQPDADRALYDEIMSEPFSGLHWQKGYNEEVTRGWTDSDDSGSDSDEDEEDDEDLVTPDSKSARYARARRVQLEEQLRAREEAERRVTEQEERVREARELLDKRVKEAYWLNGGQIVDGPPAGLYGWKDLTTKLSAFQLDDMVSGQRDKAELRAISSAQLQRELLYALTYRPNVFFQFSAEDGSAKRRDDRPATRHLSPAALDGLLSNYKIRVSHISQINHFVRQPPSSASGRPSKTAEAFAEGCRRILQELTTWLSSIETSLINRDASLAPSVLCPAATLASSPLLLLRELDHRHGSVLDHLVDLLPLARHPLPLLDALYAIISSRYASRPDDRVSSDLLRLFTRSAQPAWAMLGDWLQKGMPCPRALLDPASATSEEDERVLDPEFWLVRDRDVSWADEDFWEAGYVVRGEAHDEHEREDDWGGEPAGQDRIGGGGWPAWLDAPGVKEAIIETGKAKGLLKGLNGSREASTEWPTLDSVLLPAFERVSAGEVDLADVLASELEPFCSSATSALRCALNEDCFLVEHLDAIESLMYMRNSPLMDEWSDWFLQQIRRGRPWADFQTLTAAMRDLVGTRDEQWMNPTAIRIKTSRRAKDAPTLQEKLSHVRADYEVPFPLSQLFTSTSIDLRADTFTFLLQLLCARKQLVHAAAVYRERTSSREDRKTNDAHLLLNLRQRTSWVLDTITTWLNERVIPSATGAYRTELLASGSLGAMIKLELKHARAVRTFSFQHSSTEQANDAVATLLDLAGQVSALVEHAAKAANSGTTPARERSQGRDRRRGRSSTESDDELYEDEDEEDPLLSSTSVSGRQETTREQTLVLWRSLDDQVYTLQQATEALRDGHGGANPHHHTQESWGVLHFMLQDWR